MFETHGYPLEFHEVQTEDGYVLTLLRVPRGKDTENVEKEGLQEPEVKRPAVLLVHGVTCSADLWFMNSPEKTLPYKLVLFGYDVWIATTRGTTHSKSHTSIPVDSRKFWDFSFHEIGMFDIPALINYVLDKSEADNLFYIGHSMGCTELLILLSMRPEYCAKVNAMVALAPAIYFRHFENKWIRSLFPLGSMMGKFRRIYRNEIANYSTKQMVAKVCPPCKNPENLARWAIKTVGAKIGGLAKGQVEKSRFAAISSVYPAGTSLKTFTHFSQFYYSGKFQQYDYGRSGNIKKYGQRLPPSYDLKNVEVPILTFCSEADEICTAKDVGQLSQELPNLIKHFKISNPRFGHSDFIVGKDAAEMVYDRIIEVFKDFETVTITKL